MKIALLGYGRMGKEIEKIALSRGHEIVIVMMKIFLNKMLIVFFCLDYFPLNFQGSFLLDWESETFVCLTRFVCFFFC